MSRRTLLAALLAGLAVTLGGDASAEPPGFGRVTTVDLPRGRRAERATLADVDGDGRRDLLVLASSGRGSLRRTLRVHLRRAGTPAFGSTPDLLLPILPDVVGFAVADVHEDPGAEILLLTADGVFALRPRATDERDRYVRLFEADVLYQLPQPRDALLLTDLVRDVDGDGLADLVIPEPSGYRVALQRRERTAEDGVRRRFDMSVLRLPDDGAATPRGTGARRADARRRRRELRLSISLGGDASAAGDLLAVAESVPAPQLRDFDGDGRADLLAQSAEELLVWLRHGGQPAFHEAPDVRVPLPLEVDRRRLLDVSFAALTDDVDGDGRADYVLVAGDQDADEPRAQVALYTHAGDGSDGAAPLFGRRGRPQQLLLVAGLAGAPRLRDVDGDGRPDLVIGAVRLDALDAIRAAAGGTIDAEMYVYAARDGRLSKRPVLTHTLSVPADALRHGEGEALARFVGDVTGDGISELLLRDDPVKLRVMMVRRSRDGLAVVPRPLFETSIPEKADVSVTATGEEPVALLAVSRGEVLHVELAR